MAVKSTVLIVDDEPLGRDTLEALLIGEGYKLDFAANGAEAVSQIKALKPDLVLLDVMMPDIDGFEVCRRVRADPALAEIPVIMVTALDDRDSRLRGIEAGADDFVTKPFDRLELRTRVRTITRLDRYRRLLAERARLEWIVDQAQEGYVWLNEQDEILYANPSARLFLDLPRGEIGSEFKFLQVAQQHYRCEPEAVWAEWGSADAEMVQGCHLIRPETPTATAFWLRLTVLDSPFDSDGHRIVRLQNVTDEVSGWVDMRGFHEALRHKMRTPFTGILGSLELLAKRSGDMDRADVVDLAQMAIDSARRLYDALKDVLGYLEVHSVAESGHPFSLTNLEALVADVASALDIASIRVVCAEQVQDEYLVVSRQAVELILWELFENAVKFHPQHTPAVQVHVRRIDRERVGLYVIDDGVHISPEHLPHLWRPYYQGEKYFTGESKGMGLGLSAVAGLVWNVGGTCRISNRDDWAGVQVELILPVYADRVGISV